MRNFTLFAAMAAVAALPVQGAWSEWLSPGFVSFNMQAAAKCMQIEGKVNPLLSRNGFNPVIAARRAVVSTEPRLTRAGISPATTKATKVKTYAWDNNGWVKDDLYTFTFDGAGNVAVELIEDAEGDFARTVNQYNDNGMLTFGETQVSGDGVNYTNNSKEAFEYDPILTKVITQKDERFWLGGEWRPGNCYKRIINRDERGNITSVVIAVLFNGEYDPTQRLTVTYGADGKATELSQSVLQYDYSSGEYYWEQAEKYTNLTWDRTDGQIYDIEDLFLGANRMKSGVYVDPDGISMPISVEYSTEDDGYLITMTATEDGLTLNATTQYTPLENDGYLLEVNMEMMGMTIMSVKDEVRYDEWGLMTLQKGTEEAYGQGSGYDIITGTVEYDAEGKPSVYTVVEESSEIGETQVSTDYIIKAEYSDYVDVTAGVGSVMDHEAAEKWYDLNGLPVAKPEKGRIVVKKGRKSIEY